MFKVEGEEKIEGKNFLSIFRLGRVAEAVSLDHVDRFCDRAADKILDKFIEIDRHAKTGIELVLNDKVALLTGEAKVRDLNVDKMNEIATSVLKSFFEESGYRNISIQTILRYQDNVLTTASSEGAGDQSVCTGYATDITPELIPNEQITARNLVNILWEEAKINSHIGKDGKVIVYNSCNGMEASIRWQNDGTMAAESKIISILEKFDFVSLKINKGAEFIHGSIYSDTGVLGRKLVCDAYGASIPIGGGAISGKDASKVDRFGNYAARWAACELVRRYGGDAYVWIVYTLGLSEPVFSFFRCITENKIFFGSIEPSQFSAKKIRNRFELNRVEAGFYEKISSTGHFGCYHPWD